MNARTARIFLAVALTTALPLAARAEINLADWLYFPMYAGDNAHSVHLSALKIRPDGLLESASRYPRYRDEPWTAQESARGWYNYVPRLIDCEDGFSIETGERLLDQNGLEIARRDDAAENLADWKRHVKFKLSNHKWPDNSEFVLACAGAADPQLRARRRKLAAAKPLALTYVPLMATLRRDTTALAAKKTWHYKVSASATTPKQLFDDVARSYRAWLKGFMPGSKPAAAAAAQTALNADLRNWLSGRGADIDSIVSYGDGTIAFVDRSRTAQVPRQALDQRPAGAANASHTRLLSYVDCRTGLRLPARIEWQDDQHRTLATQTIAVAALAEMMRRELRNRNALCTNALAQPMLAPTDDLACRATAAQCAGVAPAGEAFRPTAAERAAIEQAPTPAAALLAVRAVYRAYRRRYVPNCRISTNK